MSTDFKLFTFCFHLQTLREPITAGRAEQGAPAATERTQELFKLLPAGSESVYGAIRFADGAAPDAGSHHD